MNLRDKVKWSKSRLPVCWCLIHVLQNVAISFHPIDQITVYYILYSNFINGDLINLLMKMIY